MKLLSQREYQQNQQWEFKYYKFVLCFPTTLIMFGLISTHLCIQMPVNRGDCEADRFLCQSLSFLHYASNILWKMQYKALDGKLNSVFFPAFNTIQSIKTKHKVAFSPFVKVNLFSQQQQKKPFNNSKRNPFISAALLPFWEEKERCCCPIKQHVHPLR